MVLQNWSLSESDLEYNQRSVFGFFHGPIALHSLLLSNLSNGSCVLFHQGNLNLVLSILHNSPLEPIRYIPLIFLTLKVIFLIAITSARRVSELAAFVYKELFLVLPMTRWFYGLWHPLYLRWSPRCILTRILLPSIYPKLPAPGEQGSSYLGCGFCNQVLA